MIIGLILLFAGVYVTITSFLFNSWFKQYVVYAQIGNFSPYFFTLALVIALFAIILLYRSVKFGLTSLRLLFLSLLSASLSYFFGWANWNPLGSIPLTAFFELQLLMSTLSLVFLFIHFELNEREKPRSWLTAFISLCLVPFSLKNIYSLITGDYHPYTTFEFYLRTLVQVGAVIIFVLAFLTSLRIFRALAHHSNKGKLLGGMQFSGVLLLLINVFLEFTEGILELLGSDISTYNTPLFVIAMLLISIPYFINPDLITLVPPNVKVIGLVDESGITHYYQPISEDFASSKERNLSSQLFGGLTIAFKSVGEEVAQSKKGVDSLNFGDRTIILEYSSPYYLVVIAENVTYFLHLEMKEYIRELKRIYPKPDDDGSLIPDKVFKKLNRRFFSVLTPFYITTETT